LQKRTKDYVSVWQKKRNHKKYVKTCFSPLAGFEMISIIAMELLVRIWTCFSPLAGFEMISIIAMELLVRIWTVLVFTWKEISPAKMKIVLIIN
jgi:hypothetical protein